MNEHFLTDIEIKEFKCFHDFKASGFKRVNLIGGKNNIGKTALMEAVYINVHSKNIGALFSAIVSIKTRRENLNLIGEEIKRNDSKKFLEFLDNTRIYEAISNIHTQKFFINEKDAKKEYKALIDQKEITINSNELNITTVYMDYIQFIDNFGLSNSELNIVFEAIQKLDKEHELNIYIQDFDKSIISFKVIGDRPQCKSNGEYKDITEFGDGLRHYISIICALYACKNGYLFIDEIDNGIYYEHFDQLWEIILTLSKQTNCQVFATTHSKEMLDSFARVSERLNEQDISYTLLVKNKKQELKTISLGFSDIMESIINQGHEIR